MTSMLANEMVAKMAFILAFFFHPGIKKSFQGPFDVA